QSEALRNSARRSDVEGVVRKADVIRRNVDRLSRLVSSLLDLSRIAAGRLEIELEQVNLAALVRDVAARFEEEAERAGCRLVLDLEEGIAGMWDALRLDEVLTNLLSNAIKYGPGRPVEVRTRRAGDDVALVSVRDHGIGISEADQRRIFERFERAVSKRNYGGFGLGLWISRQIVHALGGEVHVVSAPGEGSTFTVELRNALRTSEPAETGDGRIGPA
ncbi:MAG TPA: HAMP domain-containing sensor histidine kinase, partial [Anaeromyxobacteraceae bacterium]|nr:HAMP domain-containing sensor histidine kinase [Anaeromyxobacteraceae bacterium]